MEKLIKCCNDLGCKYLENEKMSRHTTFKIGGEARLVVFPESEEQISQFVKCVKSSNVRLIAIGNGSNLLVNDSGLDACVMVLGDGFSKIKLIDDTAIYAEAGAKLTSLCRFACENALTGLEFAYGIPGTCGGAAFMNAGAYGGEMKDVLYKCDHIESDGSKSSLCGEKLELSYRHSAYYDNGAVITGLYLKLKKGNKTEIKAKMDDLISRRKAKQPLEYPSAGSTFKRPEGNYAGALIEQCGLKGASSGGAQVSEKHAGFIINKGGASCNDVLELCKLVSDEVYKKTGIKLEREIRVTM